MAQSFEDLTSQFNAAADHLRSLVSSLKPEHLLRFYAFYKQATIGECQGPKPGWFQFEAKQKWEAWNALGTMSKNEAMSNYIALITAVDPEWESSDKSQSSSGWVSVSCFAESPEPELEEDKKTVFDHVREGQLDRVKDYASGKSDMNVVDEEGMGLIHWASDRGNNDMVKCLLELGSDVNLRDGSGQTPLHYACSCGHADVISTLLKFGADRSLLCDDGCSPSDIAIDDSVRLLVESS